MTTQDQRDAATLRRAAAIIRTRSKRPDSFMVTFVCRVLENTARRIEGKP